MPRRPTGQIIERHGARGRSLGLRFRAYGKRHYVTAEATTYTEAETELRHILADVERGIWKPPAAVKPEAPKEEPTFHAFASEWLEARRPELRERTFEDYRWALTHHLLPFFARAPPVADRQTRSRSLSNREGARACGHERENEDARKRGEPIGERGLSANTINKTLTRLSQILDAAVDYDLIPANPAAGKRRRLKPTRPQRGWVEPGQLMSLLDVAGGMKSLLAGRGRPLLATLSGAGLRIDEALSLERRHLNLANGTLAVVDSKTAAGVRIVDLTPALRDELAVWLDRSPFKRPTDLVFPTLKGQKDNRQNVRRRLLLAAVKRANAKLTSLGIEPIGDNIGLHGLRRTYASLRAAVGDDVAYTSEQLGHTDPVFSLRVYTHAVRRRQRLEGAELEQFTRAIEWAEWAQVGTNGVGNLATPLVSPNVAHTKTPR
jgi:integrase